MVQQVCQSAYGTYIRGATTVAARYIGHPAAAIPASEMVKTMMDEVAPPIHKYHVVTPKEKKKIDIKEDALNIMLIFADSDLERKEKKTTVSFKNDTEWAMFNGFIRSVQYLNNKYHPEIRKASEELQQKKDNWIKESVEFARRVCIEYPEYATMTNKLLYNIPIDETKLNNEEKVELMLSGFVSGFIKDSALGLNGLADAAIYPIDTMEVLTSPDIASVAWDGMTRDIKADWKEGTIQGKSEAVGRTASVALPFLGVISKITKATGTAGKLTGTAAREAAERATQEAAERAAQEATERAAQEAAERAAQEAAERTAQETTERAGKEVSQEVAERARKTDNSIPVKRGDSGSGANGSGVKISGEKPNHNIDNVKITEANGNELREDGIQTNNVTEQPKIQVTKQPQKPQIQNTNIHKHTMPSQPPNILATPNGTKTKVNYNDPELDNIRSLIRENEAAETLAQAGYKIEQNPKVPGTKNPDYLIENKIFDCYSPREGTSVRNIASSITRKIDSGQTNRIILNLDDWHGGGGDIDEIIKQLNEWSIPGLKEVKVINHYHEIIDIYP